MAIMITTSDNPFDPFDEWDLWFNFDMVKGYNTPGLLDRITVTSSVLSEADQEADREQAMREVVKENINGMYLLLTRD